MNPETKENILMRFSREEVVSFLGNEYPSFDARKAPKNDLIRYMVIENGVEDRMLEGLTFNHLKKPELQEYLIRVCRHQKSYASNDCKKGDLIEKVQAEKSGPSPLEVLKAVQSDGEAVISEVDIQPTGENEVLPAPVPGEVEVSPDVSPPVESVASPVPANNLHGPATFEFPKYQLDIAQLVFDVGIDSFCSFIGKKSADKALLRAVPGSPNVRNYQVVPCFEITVVDMDGLDKDKDFFSPSFSIHNLPKLVSDYQVPDGSWLFQQREIAWLELAEFLTPKIIHNNSLVVYPGDWDLDRVGSASEFEKFVYYHLNIQSTWPIIEEWIGTDVLPGFSPDDVINGRYYIPYRFTKDLLLSLFLICKGYPPLQFAPDPRCLSSFQDWRRFTADESLPPVESESSPVPELEFNEVSPVSVKPAADSLHRKRFNARGFTGPG